MIGLCEKTVPGSMRGLLGGSRTKVQIRKELEEWEETTKEKITRLETAIEDHARGAFNRFDDVLGDIVPRVGVPIETTKKVLETLKAELIQFEEYQRFQEGQFTSPIPNNSILAGAD